MAADGRWHPLVDGCPPSWASSWGQQDGLGVFVGFSVGGVEQRMRWVPAGTFMMGSPKGEVGRDDDEGPQHEVTISRGFWLGETPVTQELWTAVTGNNPSHFKGEDTLPVEKVRWDECQKFCKQLNRRIEGLRVGLPTEAQWEHACRAGTKQPRYSAKLDDIAWYSGNSDGKSHPVGQKQPNAFGLYDMLGNVWEWCRDGMRPYDRPVKPDPVGPTDTGVYRVNRGGSWAYTARFVRAAFRFLVVPGYRSRSLGLRLARDQDQPAEDSAG